MVQRQLKIGLSWILLLTLTFKGLSLSPSALKDHFSKATQEYFESPEDNSDFEFSKLVFDESDFENDDLAAVPEFENFRNGKILYSTTPARFSGLLRIKKYILFCALKLDC